MIAGYRGVAHEKLDAAVVYEANCQNLDGKAEFVQIRHPKARAIQNIAASRRSRHKHLGERLIRAILSARNRKRFESNGFGWLGDGTRE